VRKMTNAPTRILVLAFYLLATGSLSLTGLSAQSPRKTPALLSVARDVLVNNSTAATGLAVLSNSRIKTGPQGMAGLNLGQSGHLALGHSADLALQYSPTSVGGSLNAGRVAISAPAGVAVMINTAYGAVTSDGRNGIDLVVEVVNSQTHIGTLNNEANVVFGARSRKVSLGEEVIVDAAGVKAEPLPSTGGATGAPQGGAGGAAGAAGGISPMTLLTIVTSFTTLGIAINNGVNQRKTSRDLQNLIRRIDPSAIR